MRILGKTTSVSIVTDTQYFDGLESWYPDEILILHTVLVQSRKEILHLSIEDAEHIVSKTHPRLCILTHFGMGIIKERPWKLAEELSKKCGINIVAAYDGMELNLDALCDSSNGPILSKPK